MNLPQNAFAIVLIDSSSNDLASDTLGMTRCFELRRVDGGAEYAEDGPDRPFAIAKP